MRNIILLLFTLVFIVQSRYVGAQYTFQDEVRLKCTDIKNQQKTGTCWSFATASFLESELARMGGELVDLSEMYVVRGIYNDKAMNYMLRQGKANFSQGSLSHDLMRMIKKVGIMPQSAYDGKINEADPHDHGEMEVGLKGFLDGVRSRKRLSSNWKSAFNGILDAYMGALPETFQVDGQTYTPQEYAASFGIDTDEYVSITSFTHHPFDEKFILEIPDNYSNGSYYNVPIHELVNAIDVALSKGYSVAWDGDVSEEGFSSREGLAILPLEGGDHIFNEPVAEVSATQAYRQALFENYATTDDHLMHIVGSAKDQNGTKYYIIKNSWGKRGPYSGYLYMSETYVKMKTIAIMLHESALTFEVSD